MDLDIFLQNFVGIIKLHHWPAFFPEWENIVEVMSDDRIFTQNRLCNLRQYKGSFRAINCQVINTTRF